MKKTNEIKIIFSNRLYNKKKSKIINNSISNNISASSINNSHDNSKTTIKTNSNLYFKPRPIYIISNINQKHNIRINTSKQRNNNNLYNKIPQTIKTYKVHYNNRKYILSTERNRAICKDFNDYNKYGYNTLNDSIKSNSFKIRNFKSTSNSTSNSIKYFNNINEKNEKCDNLNTYNKNNDNNIKNRKNINEFNKTLDSIYKTKKVKKSNTNMNIRKLNNIIFNNNKYNINNNNKNTIDEIKQKSSKNKDILGLCKILKSFEKKTNILLNNEDYKDYNKKQLTRKHSKEKQKINNKYLINYKNIILIQKWWKDMKYKNYIQKSVTIIQKHYRGYIFRKNNIYYSFISKINRNPNILNKIIYIQKLWKNYLKNIKQSKLDFSFTNNEDNDINIINNNGLICIGNSYRKNYDNYPKTYKVTINNCFITKKYFTKVNQQINNISIIQKCIKKYLANKNKINNIYNISYEKTPKKIKNNKSRNKKNNIWKNKRQIYLKDESISLVNNPKKEYRHFSYNNTPNKEKNKNLLEEYGCLTMCSNFNYKEKYSRYNTNETLYKQKNNICYISKIRKNINLLNIISFLKNKIKKHILKNRFYFSKIKLNGCYINKNKIIINNILKYKIILLQRNIKNYLTKINNNKLNMSGKGKILLSDIRYKLTNDISDEKRKYENSDLNINNISPFDFNDNKSNKSNKYDIIIENKNTFISEDVTTFSFDFKNHAHKKYENDTQNTKSNNSKENIEEDDNNNNVDNNISNYINFSSKNMLLSNEIEISYKKLKYLFVTNITTKLSLFTIILLNRIHLFNFIKILSQRINKIINQFIFQKIFKLYKNDKEINYISNNELFFYNTLKRHIRYILYKKEKNEIQKLLIENIPKCFENYNNIQITKNESHNMHKIIIPYINKNQEKNILNTELFLNNDENLIKYFTNFYINEKGNHNLKELIIILKHRLISDKLNNRNLFTITKYIDNIYNDIYGRKNIEISPLNELKQKDYINKKYNKNMKLKQLTQINENNYYNNIHIKPKIKVNNNNDFFKGIDENIDNNIDINYNNKIFNYKDLNSENEYKMNKYNDLHSINHNYTLNKNSYKFINYINEKYNNNKLNETLQDTKTDDI